MPNYPEKYRDTLAAVHASAGKIRQNHPDIDQDEEAAWPASAEMVRKVRAGGAPVTEAAAAFGYSRPAYYAAAAALESSGLDGLVPARPGPRGASKLTEEVLAWAEEQLAASPGLRPAQLPDRIGDAFGVRVHPRSVERALARRREHSKSR